MSFQNPGCILSVLLIALLFVVHAIATSERSFDLNSDWDALQFGNAGIVRASDTFFQHDMCSAYTEGEEQFAQVGRYKYLFKQAPAAAAVPDDGEETGDTEEQKYVSPPIGMRSAMPLGGLGTGTFELRADGTVADWQLEGLGPGAGRLSKVGKAEFLIGVATRHVVSNGTSGETPQKPWITRAIATHPSSSESRDIAALPGVDGLQYSAAFPVARWSINSTQLIGKGALEMFASIPFVPRDSQTSGTPATTLTLRAQAPSSGRHGASAEHSHIENYDDDIEVAFLVALPGLRDVGWARERGDIIDGVDHAVADTSDVDCKRACDTHSDCMSWNFEVADTPVVVSSMGMSGCSFNEDHADTLEICMGRCTNDCVAIVFDAKDHRCSTKFKLCPKLPSSHTSTLVIFRRKGCSLMMDVPPPRASVGSVSGVRGSWSATCAKQSDRSSSESNACVKVLTMTRPGAHVSSGSMSLVGVGDAISSTSTGVYPSIASLWQVFSKSGSVDHVEDEDGDHKRDGGDNSTNLRSYGAVSVRMLVPAGQSRSVSIVFSWHHPHRTHGGEDIGSMYERRFNNSMSVGLFVRSQLSIFLHDAVTWNIWLMNANLPSWLADFLINTPAAMTKTSVWGRDGRFRQFESFSCDALDPLHIHLYRSIPFAFLFADLSQAKLRTGYCASQAPDGMIKEDLGHGCEADPLGRMDVSAGGRVMGDSATALTIEVLQLYRMTNDKDWLHSIWPCVTRALRWQLNQAPPPSHLPANLENTYDWWQFREKTIVSYNAVLHLASLRAGMVLARAVALDGSDDAEDTIDLVREYEEKEALAMASMETMLWSETHYRAWWNNGNVNDQNGKTDAVMTDSIYGQMWAYILDLGELMTTDRIVQHLQTERRVSATDYGLTIMHGAPGYNVYRDGLVWEAGSIDHSTLRLYLWVATRHRPVQGKSTRNNDNDNDNDNYNRDEATTTLLRQYRESFDLDDALDEAQMSITKYHRDLNDIFDWKDITAGPGVACGWALHGQSDGMPWCNSHYSRQLIGWALPLGLSNQRYDASSRTLKFSPVKGTHEMRLPFMTSLCFGWLGRVEDQGFYLALLSGQLSDVTIIIDGDGDGDGDGDDKSGDVVIPHVTLTALSWKHPDFPQRMALQPTL